ncbi:MAG: glycoside hydrolase family 43 protein [Opitutales bacterium]|nr:glycoside hydrolase family 43 protein [Opitutales bacterium]
MKPLPGFLLFLSCALWSVSCSKAPTPSIPTESDKSYLFSYFLDNGEDGLHLAWSSDGITWDVLNNGAPFLTPNVGESRLMRDPCVTQGPDGTFHMVWTDSWHSQTIGYASTKDFIHWSEQKTIPVMQRKTDALNCWAPEINYDSELGQFIIFWATTLPGEFTETWFDGQNDNNHRIYYTTTKDFEHFTPTEVFFDPGFNCIDSTILRKDGVYCMFFKDETNYPEPMKNIRLAVANHLSGPYSVLPDEITPKNSWVEGPTAVSIGEYTYLYFDVYMAHHYAALRSKDLVHWEDLSEQLSMPEGIRHGTVFSVAPEVLERLLSFNKTEKQ